MSEKLISADYLFAKIDKWVLDCDGISFEELKKTLNNAPAVDAVEVVRCKDCRYRGDEYECPLLAYSEYTCDDEYCSDGRRREENEID